MFHVILEIESNVFQQLLGTALRALPQHFFIYCLGSTQFFLVAFFDSTMKV